MGWCDSRFTFKFARRDIPQPSRIVSMKKAGLLTFTVNRLMRLSGVKIITDMAARQTSCCVSLSVYAQGSGKKIRQIKEKCFINEANEDTAYGFVDVYFNSPFSVTENTCYTIETETDTTQNDDFYVWFVPQSLIVDSRQKNHYTLDTYKSGKVSGHCSGHYTQCIPTDVCYKGEIMGLFVEE